MVFLTKKGRRRCDALLGGYSVLATARARMMSRFSLEAGTALGTISPLWDDLQRKTLSDISPYVPEDLWPFFAASDCDDPEFSPDECAKFVEAFNGRFKGGFDPCTALDWFERDPDDGAKWRSLRDTDSRKITNAYLKGDVAMAHEIRLWNALKKAADEKWTLHWD
ncbi:MAG: hypothetical protein MJZ81_10865 [Bacteroidales bacterium]|nr:hypothetical protein [Bacteroidales bacterium]